MAAQCRAKYRRDANDCQFPPGAAGVQPGHGASTATKPVFNSANGSAAAADLLAGRAISDVSSDQHARFPEPTASPAVRPGQPGFVEVQPESTGLQWNRSCYQGPERFRFHRRGSVLPQERLQGNVPEGWRSRPGRSGIQPKHALQVERHQGAGAAVGFL